MDRKQSRITRRALALTAALFGSAVSSATVQAQSPGPAYATVAGYGAGYIRYGTLNPGRGGPELALEPRWIVHGFVEGAVLGDFLGARALGAFSQAPFEFDGVSRSINTWLADAALVLRPFGLAASGAFSPFVLGGAGVITHGFGRAGRPVLIPEAGVMYSGDDQASWQLTFGGGIDIVPAGFAIGGTPVGIRIEAVDHMALRSPFTDLEGGRLGPVHNIRLGVSLVGLGSF
jgi:hypothetical protein